jgi:hypothetical protein
VQDGAGKSIGIDHLFRRVESGTIFSIVVGVTQELIETAVNGTEIIHTNAGRRLWVINLRQQSVQT